MKPHLLMRLLLVGLLGCTACQSTPEAPPHFAEESLTPEYLHQALLKRQDHVQDMKSLVKTTIVTPRKEHTLRQILILKGDDTLRLDTLSVFNQPLGVLILKGKNTLMYDTSKNKVYRDLEVWNIMYEMMGTVIDFSEYIRVFSGNIPRLQHLQWKQARLNQEKTRYVLNAVDPGRKENVIIQLDALTLLPVAMRKYNGRQPLYTVIWDDYQDVDDRPFPHNIRVIRNAQKDQVAIEYSSPKINQGVSEDAFELGLSEPPEDTPPPPAS